MPSIARSVASLRIIGDELLPEEISRLVGGSPTVAQKKGDVVRNPGRSVERVARFGMWLRKARERNPEDLDSQVEELLAGLTSDMAVWTDITARFRADVFCGLFMQHGNEGFSLHPKTLAELGARGLKFDFDVYGSADDEAEPNQPPQRNAGSRPSSDDSPVSESSSSLGPRG